MWGEDKYELANFTDDELVEAAIVRTDSTVTNQSWEEELRGKLTKAREHHHDIKIPFGQMRIPLDKPRLADILWPALLAKLHIEFAGEHAPTTPVIKLIDDITRIHHHMDGIRALQPPTA